MDPIPYIKDGMNYTEAKHLRKKMASFLQVKVRGHRLELLEIEAVMKQEAIGSNRDCCGWMFGSWMLEVEIMGNWKLYGLQECEVNLEYGILDGSFFRIPKNRTVDSVDWHLGLGFCRFQSDRTGFAAHSSWPWQAESRLSRQVEALVTLCPITL